MLKKIAFILEAAQKAKTMTESEWKLWAIKEGLKVGFTESELAEALFKKS